jgi:hypothetical protein
MPSIEVQVTEFNGLPLKKPVSLPAVDQGTRFGLYRNVCLLMCVLSGCAIDPHLFRQTITGMRSADPSKTEFLDASDGEHNEVALTSLRALLTTIRRHVVVWCLTGTGNLMQSHTISPLCDLPGESTSIVHVLLLMPSYHFVVLKESELSVFSDDHAFARAPVNAVRKISGLQNVTTRHAVMVN